MNRPKCDRCGKSLEHGGKALRDVEGVMTRYFRAPQSRADHLPVLHDALAESDDPRHRRHAAYLKRALEHGAGAEAARDIRAGMARPGGVGALRWNSHRRVRPSGGSVYRATAGHGVYEAGYGGGSDVSTTYTPHGGEPREIHRVPGRPAPWDVVRRHVRLHHARIVNAFVEE